ncbi:MAG TPA: sigma-70 family RNA polymerase sigma factor [Tepidisphaeraceae bacterium]|jgi:RNA polymerase sigma-70 factor (ECF subfamily)
MKLSREQFEKLALEQLDLLYRVARRLTRREDQAGDLVQETFLRALRSHNTFDLQAHGIRPWLVRIMHNLHFSRSDREKKQPMAMEAAPLEAASPPAPEEKFSFGMAGFEGMDERLVKALKQVPEEYQVVLLLWAVEEFSYKDIADSLDVPIGTVMSRLHRARQKLSQLLRDFAIEEGVIRE